jgi:hypothetical protein
VIAFTAERKRHQKEWCEAMTYLTGQKMEQEFYDVNCSFHSEKHYARDEVIRDNMERRWQITGVVGSKEGPIYQATLLDVGIDPLIEPKSFE